MDDGLPDKWRDGIRGVLEMFPELARALVFGSRSFGKYHKASDLDLALETNDGEPLAALRLRMLRSMLDELYLPIKIDIVDLAAIKDEHFRSVIRRDGVVWWAREESRTVA